MPRWCEKNTKMRTTVFWGKCWYYSIGGNKIEKSKKSKEKILERAEYAANITGDDEVELVF